MGVAIVFIFCLYIFFKSKKGSLSRLFSAILIASLTSYMMAFNMEDFEFIDIFHALWICFTLGCVVLSWRDYKRINEIRVKYPKRVDALNTILVVLCIVMGVSCAFLSFFVLTMVDDINRFKYVDGASDFYYSLGIDMKGFILTTLLYPIGYLLVPYFFYYLSQKRTARAIFSFIGSMLPVLFGLTYFSRSHMTHFALVYLAAFYLLGGVLSHGQRVWMKRIILVAGVGIVIGFFAISMSRFEEHSYNTENREITTKNQNSTFISTLDYFSQWWPNSQEMFRRFDGRTMNNSIIMAPTVGFFSTITFGIIPNDAIGRMNKREKLFKDYSGAFIGPSAYVLYDQGPILGVILLLLYALFVRRHKPLNGAISINSLLTVFAIIQVPLCAIFYSTFDLALLSLILLFPMKLFLSGLKKNVKV